MCLHSSIIYLRSAGHKLLFEYLKGREVYGDRQVHIQALNTNRLPLKFSKCAKPFGKDKNMGRWYYLPNTSIDMIFIIFEQAGYKQVDTRKAKDRLGRENIVYYVAKKVK